MPLRCGIGDLLLRAEPRQSVISSAISYQLVQAADRVRKVSRHNCRKRAWVLKTNYGALVFLEAQSVDARRECLEIWRCLARFSVTSRSGWTAKALLSIVFPSRGTNRRCILQLVVQPDGHLSQQKRNG